MEQDMVQHLSVRVPWTDNGFCGNICKNPCANTACLRLKNIAENKNDTKESVVAGLNMADIMPKIEAPCISEGGAFMAPFPITRIVEHPYKLTNTATHRHFCPTELVYPPYSLPGRPFGWTMLQKEGQPRYENVKRLAEKYQIPYQQDYEPNLGFESDWVQDARNQRAIFNKFYENVVPDQSLVIPYAKQVPFIEDPKRVIIGIGFVKKITPPPEYKHTSAGSLRSILWETMIEHSIRPERMNGFLMPYREMEQYALSHPDFDMRSITVFAEDEFFEEFSYATEHASHDAVISVLIQIIHALEIIKQCIPGNWDDCIQWTKTRLAEVKQERGVFPGIGTMLCAMQFKQGHAIAETLKQHLASGEDWFEKLTDIIRSPHSSLPPHLASSIHQTERQSFLSLSQKRKDLFKLLARFSLTLPQAELIFNQGYHVYANGTLIYKEAPNTYFSRDEEYYLKNPYLLYENTRLLNEELRISLREVDLAVFSHEENQPSYIDSENNTQRIRALMVSILEECANQGHTVYPQSFMIQTLNQMAVDPPCKITKDILNGISSSFNDVIMSAPLKDKSDEIAYKLGRIDEFDEEIRKVVRKRLNGIPHSVSENWDKIVNDAFSGSILSETEQKARQEKIAVLKELAASRISVLIGGAGTGKTTLLALLCKSKQINQNNILLLAPTGKSRVRMSQAMQAQGIRFEAKTVAQYLLENHCFDFQTMQYSLADSTPSGLGTVIIDESSMLTEEMFGALCRVLKSAQRIIFVGDPNQLPPIGAGRPFVDLVNRLKPDKESFPYVAKGFGALTVPRRQTDETNERADLLLSEWFNSQTTEPNDEIFDAIEKGVCATHIIYKKWNTPEELYSLILEQIASETSMKDIYDLDGFDRSLGGMPGDGKWMNFGGNISAIEQWQILSPLKNDTVIGTSTINRIIHEWYRSHTKEHQVKGLFQKRKTEKILGTDGIIFGDKVINVRNKKLNGYPTDGCLNYVANGEIGIVWNLLTKNYRLQKLNVKFSSQPDHSYGFSVGVSDNSDSDLELAYALTIHKAQGSEFKKVILILSDDCRLLSRELFYTAITRQTEKLIILYNNSLLHLQTFTSAENSSVSLRLTNLFEDPSPIEHKNKYYENSLVHRTLRGEFVRSKSEVIIANQLFNHGIPYKYEEPLVFADGRHVLPDFTIEDAESGIKYYWEHCGMMDNPSYRARWEVKKQIYQDNGIQEGTGLLVSEDRYGAIDTQEIENIIKTNLL